MDAMSVTELVARCIQLVLSIWVVGLLARISMTLELILHEMRHRDGK